MAIQDPEVVIRQRVALAGDMEANDWNFDQWSEWVKKDFPEMANWRPEPQLVDTNLVL